jgi:hypothetical protein
MVALVALVWWNLMRNVNLEDIEHLCDTRGKLRLADFNVKVARCGVSFERFIDFPLRKHLKIQLSFIASSSFSCKMLVLEIERR